MENNNIKENFNGKITLGNENYFFDVNNNILKIFFNENGIKTVADFNRTYLNELKKGWLYGVCEDKFRVCFHIREVCMSEYPSVFAKYKIFVCVKEKFHVIDFNKEKVENFNIFNGIKISGDLIDKICARGYFSFDNDLNVKLENELLLSPENVFIPKREIQVNKNTKCSFEVISVINDENVNQVSYNSNILFTFYNSKKIDNIVTLYYSIKNFIDILCFARNTIFNIELTQKYNNKVITFADVKIYENYRNYCNRPIQEVVQIKSIENNLNEIFNNLSDNKYSLLFLPIDNDDLYRITYSDIQNLTTAIELASDMDKKIKKNYDKFEGITNKKDRNDATALEKATIIFNWCKKYTKLLEEKYQNNKKSLDDPFYYELTIEKIKSFRTLRNRITHSATGKIDMNICNCYHSLRYVLCNYILDIDGNDENNRYIVHI